MGFFYTGKSEVSKGVNQARSEKVMQTCLVYIIELYCLFMNINIPDLTGFLLTYTYLLHIFEEYNQIIVKIV